MNALRNLLLVGIVSCVVCELVAGPSFAVIFGAVYLLFVLKKTIFIVH